MSGGGEDGLDAVGVEFTAMGAALEPCGRLVRRHRRPVRPGLDRRPIRDCGSENALRLPERRSAESQWIAGPVEVLVVGPGDACHLPETRDAGEDAVGEIRVHADALPLRRGEVPGLRPDLIRHPDSPDVMKPPRTTSRVDVRSFDTEVPRSRFGQRRHSA